MREQTKNALGRVQDEIANLDAAIRINPEDAEVYFKRGLARKALRQFALAKRDFEHAKNLAQEQGLKELLSYIDQESKNLNVKPFRVIPHRQRICPRGRSRQTEGKVPRP